MKLQPDRIETQSVTAYGSGWIAIQGEKISHSVLITSEGVRLDWHCQSFEDLGAEHFAQLAELDVELVIFGIQQSESIIYLGSLLELGSGYQEFCGSINFTRTV